MARMNATVLEVMGALGRRVDNPDYKQDSGS